jgi:hypothetical protein
LWRFRRVLGTEFAVGAPLDPGSEIAAGDAVAAFQSILSKRPSTAEPVAPPFFDIGVHDAAWIIRNFSKTAIGC